MQKQRAARKKHADPRGRVRWAVNEPVVTVGTLRGSLGISAWRSIAHRTVYESGPLFIEHWFKKRLPPTPTLQAGFLSQMLWKSRRDDKACRPNSWKFTCGNICERWRQFGRGRVIFAAIGVLRLGARSPRRPDSWLRMTGYKGLSSLRVGRSRPCGEAARVFPIWRKAKSE